MRHEIMTKRTRAEIDELAKEMVAAWKAAGSHQSNDGLRARAMGLIFGCLAGAQDEYKQKAESNG